MRTKAQDRERKRKEWARDPEKSRAKDKARRAAHPGWPLVARAKARAMRAGVPFNLTAEDLVIPARCPILGIPIAVQQLGKRQPHDNSLSLDRIIPELGYVKGNVAVISQRANRIKNDGTAAELRAIAEWMESHAG